MADSILLTKSKAFALPIIRFYNEIKKDRRESVLTNQLLRSGSVSEPMRAKRSTRTVVWILSPSFKSP